MNFGEALELLKMGRVVTRSGWNGKEMYIASMYPEGGSEMTLPYIYMKTADNKYVPWLASQADLFSEDWSLFEYPKEQKQEDKDALIKELKTTIATLENRVSELSNWIYDMGEDPDVSSSVEYNGHTYVISPPKKP